MTTYHELHWDSLNFVKNHAYRRLASPLNNALGRLAIAQHVDQPDEAQAQLRLVARNLELALNLIKAWAALIHVKSGGAIPADQRRVIAPEALPAWLVEHLKGQISVQLEHTKPVFVHPEIFYESLSLACQIGAAIGTLKSVSTLDARTPGKSVWIRAVFAPPPGSPYRSLDALIHRLDTQNPADNDTLVALSVLSGFLEINGAALKIQNNTQSGDQALAACLPAAPESVLAVAAVDVTARVSEPAPPEGAGESADETQETVFTQLLRDLDQPAPEQTAAAPTAPAPAPDEAPENAESTLIVPPPNLWKRLRALDAAVTEPGPSTETPSPESAPPPPTVSPPDTLIVPPPNLRERLTALGDTPPPAEDESETLIVPPPNWQKRLDELSEAMSQADTPSPAPDETVADSGESTLIVPPPSLRERLAALDTSDLTAVSPAADKADQPSPSDTPDDADRPAAPDAIDEADRPADPDAIELVPPENAPNTLIVPPPDIQRRLAARRLSAPTDEAPPEADAPPPDDHEEAPPAEPARSE